MENDHLDAGALLIEEGIVALLMSVGFEASPFAEPTTGTGSIPTTASAGGSTGGDVDSQTAGGTNQPDQTPAHAYMPGAAQTRCSFGDCARNGSTGQTADGAQVDTRCRFGDCSKNGWTTTSGTESSDTVCSFGDCSKNGWTTSSGTAHSDTRCTFGDCSTNGWTTTNSDGTSSDTRCNFGDCHKNGWTTTGSSGHTVTCTCRFNDCDANGVDCN
jgi:hypothetical protein